MSAREVLFRGKRTDNGEWVEGYYAKSGLAFILIDNRLVCGYFEMLEVDPETVCQYTGLTDKNGRKIFEGDICKLEDYHGNRTVYVFYGDCGSWFYGGDGFSDEYIWNGNYKEVIGNIFDNPELLNRHFV